MAKKKKNKSYNDVRGYATTNSQSSTPPLLSSTNQQLLSKEPAASRMKVTTDIQQTMESLLRALHSLQEDSMGCAQDMTAVEATLPPLTALENIRSYAEVDAAKLRRRVGAIYDSLMEFGFNFRQIQNAITACKTNVTLTLALDWLCYNIPTSDLPTLFTEGLIRESETTKSIDTVGVTLIPALHATPSMVAEVVSPPTDFVSNMSLGEVNKHEASKVVEDKEKWSSEQKALLLARYAFNRTSESDDESLCSYSPVSSLQKTSNGIYRTSDSIAISKESASLDNTTAAPLLLNDMNTGTPALIDSADTLTNDIRIRFEALQCELNALEEDLRNEANNYMRSKHEIKDLKQKANILRKEVGVWEAKLRLRTTDKNRLLKVETTTNGKVDDDHVADLFSFFDEVDDDDTQQDLPKERCNAPAISKLYVGIRIPDDSLPSGWTGQTPKGFLEEFCRKEKIAKPVFEKLSLNGCRLHIKRKAGNKTFEEPGPHSNYLGLQHYLSMKALYEIAPSLPLYRLFPPFYRDIWINWINSEKQEELEQSDIRASIRNEKINALMECIKLASASFSDDSKKVVRHGLSEETFIHSSNRPSKFRALIVENMTDGPTESGSILQKEFNRRKASQKFKAMLSVRSQLPIHCYRELILETIREHPVTILCAETGSGKTTQCGSFLLEEAFCEGRGDRISVLCTQPRRVAAMSVAERVAAELGELNVGKLVGYQIRMEAKRSSETKLLFCTTGVILRRMIEDPELKGVSHVIVDEVHERQWQIDVLLVALRTLIGGTRPDLKLVLMSATLDAKLFGSFFMGAPCLNIPGRTFPVRVHYLEDLLEQTNHVIEDGSCYARRDRVEHSSFSIQITSRGGEKRRETIDYEYENHEDFSGDFSDYSKETRSSLRRVDEAVINYDLIEDILDEVLLKKSSVFTPCLNGIEDIQDQPSTGAVLIFLPGLEEIRTLMERLKGSKTYGNAAQFQIFPLHSTLSSSEQKLPFMQTPPGCRKIVISTNVAETSVTIPDVVYVIDSGRVREITRNRKSNSRKLVTTWCSKASARQRAGRAGRVQPGVCLKLYSSRTEQRIMREATEPELLRIPLEEVCLTILAGGFGKNCTDFLSQTPQPPSDEAVRSAIKVLEDIGAIITSDSSSNEMSMNRKETLTSLGSHLAKLPVDARIGKMLIFGALFQCTDSILTIAAFLTSPKSPFLTKFGDRLDVAPQHSQFLHPFSDFATYVNLWSAFEHAVNNDKEKDFCRQNFLSYTAMRDIQYARRHYLELLFGLGFLDLASIRDGIDERDFDKKFKLNHCNRNANVDYLVHSVIYAGLFPNVAHVSKATTHGDFMVVQKAERLHVQSPVMSKIKVTPPSSWITYYEKFGTERRVSISRIAFLSTIGLLLFSQNMQVLHSERKVIVDGWIEVTASAKTGVVFREFQNRFADFLTAQFDSRQASSQQASKSKKIDSIIDLIVVLLSKA